jgi:hypothetical protein
LTKGATEFAQIFTGQARPIDRPSAAAYEARLADMEQRLSTLSTVSERLSRAAENPPQGLPGAVAATAGLPAPSEKLDWLLAMAGKLDAQHELVTRLGAAMDKTSATVEALSFMLNDNAAVKTLAINDRLMLVKLTFGPSLYMDPRDTMLTMAISRVGYWEPENTHFVSSRVRHGVNCIDIGANYGYYMALFCGIVGNTATVLAFEPNPVVYSYLRQTAFTGRCEGACAGEPAGRDGDRPQ